jgi:protein CpxP
MSKRFIARLLALALAATWSVAVYAQQPDQNAGQQGGEGRGGRMGRGPMTPQAELDRLTKQLDLTKDQQDKIKPILEDQQKQMQALREDTSTAQQDRFTKMRDIRKSHMDQVRAVLTSDQQTKFDEMQKRMMERGGPGRGMGGDRPQGDQPPPPPQV